MSSRTASPLCWATIECQHGGLKPHDKGVREGQQFTRPRGFAKAPGGRHKWWLAGVTKGVIRDSRTGEDLVVDGTGAEHVEIIEIVPTRTFGRWHFIGNG